MRRSICYCEPATATAGEVGTWRFIYTTSTALPKNTKLKFDLGSRGRDIDWEVPEVNLKKASNVIYLQLEDGTILAGKPVEVPNSFVPQFEFQLPSPVALGESFAIIVGAKDAETAKKGGGNRAQTATQRRRAFSLYIDPTGKQRYGEPETFTMDILGGTLTNIRVISPSLIAKNKRFDLIVRFEDQFGNLTSHAPEDTLIELSYEHLRENLNWKLFVPETGFITLPNLYFNEPGVYTIQLKNAATGELFRSCPIRCFGETGELLLWGLLHGESDKIDSTENVDSCLRHFRDEKAFNFFSVSPFENSEETSNDVWKTLTQSVQEFDEEDRFTTLLGFQWVGEKGSEGVREIVYLKDQKQLIRKKDAKGATLEKLYKSFSPKEILSIPCFTMGKGFEYDFKKFSPEFERVVEIYNAWGSSECTAKEGNICPVQSGSKTKGAQECAEGAIQKALQNNCRFGFVAGGLDDRGLYANFFESDQTQYPPGLTAVIALGHSKNAIGEALYNRSCYATTGEKIVLGFSIAGAKMGGELSTKEKPGLTVNRHISAHVAGTTTIAKIEIIRNGKVIHTLEPDSYHTSFTFDDLSPLEKVCLPAKQGNPPFVYYYLRVTQEDGHTAWGSPIWIDLMPETAMKKVKVDPKKSGKLAKPVVAIEEDLNFDEEEEEEEEEDFE